VDASIDESRLRALGRNLAPSTEAGILAPPSPTGALSFPDGGHQECLQLEEGSFWFRHRNRCIVEVLARHPPNGPLFDIGGGNGFVTLAIQSAGYPAVLVEPAMAGARSARDRGLSPVVCSTVEDAGFSEGALPAVGLFDVIEHLEDDVGFLAKLRRLQPTGGMLYITVPAYSWLWSAEDVHAGHFRRYRLRSLRRLVEESGYRVEFASYLFAALPLPLLLMRGLSGLVKARPTAQQQHDVGRMRGLADAVLGLELPLLRRGRALPFGSSCLVAATAV
jgi:hypothetical protein